MKYKGIYSRKLTIAFRRIFGNVVEKVFIGCDEKWMKESVEKYKEEATNPITNTGQDTLHWNTSDIIVQFANSRKVYMTNSEWASFSKVHNFKEIK